MNYIVSIIGRQNVGKSTLFNRIIGYRKAVVHKTGGVTRDNIYAYLKWNNTKFTVIDTGGIDDIFIRNYKNDILFNNIMYFVNESIKKSDIILFLVDVRKGIINTDIEIANFLRKKNKIIFLVINKVDHGKLLYLYKDFLSLGFNYNYCISAENGSGVCELLDSIIEILITINKQNTETKYKFLPKLSIIGRTNAGKSTLINALLNKYKHIVTDVSGTTRDNLEVEYNNNSGYKCILIDTPGLKKTSKISNNVEFYSITRTIKSIENTDVCLLMIDMFTGWNNFDKKIFEIIKQHNKGIIIIVNKVDLYEKHSLYNKIQQYKQSIIYDIHPFYNIPIFFISAKNKYKIYNIIPKAFNIIKIKEQRIKTNLLNKIILPIIKKHPPIVKKRNLFINIKYCTQVLSSSPKFIFFVNHPKYLQISYKKFLEKTIRYYFGFEGVPIQIFFKKNSNSDYTFKRKIN